MDSIRLLVGLCLQLYFFSFAHAQNTPSLIPPSTFPSASASATTSAASGNSSITATPTNTASFPSLSGYSPCVVNCLGLSVAKANCSSEIAINCFCGNKNFTNEIVRCASSTCPAELGTAEALAQQFCNLASTNTSLSFPTPSVNVTAVSSSPSPTPTAISTSTTATTSTPTPASAARGIDASWALSNALLISAVLGALGISFGAF